MGEKLSELIMPLRALGLESAIDAFLWLLLTFIGGLMPLWGGYIVLRALSQSPGLFTFTENGEFALYSASILAATIFAVSKEIGPNAASYLRDRDKGFQISDLIRITFPYHRGINVISIALIAVSALVFATVMIARIPGVGLPLDKSFVQHLTVAVFVISLLIGLLVTAIDSTFMSQVELRRRAEEPISRLKAEFDALEDSD